ncbi:MAG: ribonuclease D [Polyangiales bacterium]
MPETLLIDDPASLARAVDELSRAPAVALDCEGNGMHAYRTDLCLAQLCVARDDAPADRVYVVDTLALADLTPLARLLGAEGPPKVLHDLGFDARLLMESGLGLDNVRDTSVCARFLGAAATGLASMLSTRLGVTLDKSLQAEDWARRPLTREALEYLANDVAWLGPLWASLSAEVADAGIADEVDEETRYGLRRAQAAPGEEPPPFARVSGYRDLGGLSRAVLVRVAAVREALAEERDVPVGRLVPNAVMIQLAKVKPRDRDSLRRVWKRFDDRAEAWLGAVREGVEAGDLTDDERRWFEREPKPRDLRERKWRESALTAWRAAEAEARGVDRQVVLPGHCLSEIVARRADTVEALSEIDGFGRCRVERYGEALAALLRAPDEA